ncbi:MAG TPA: hypothetical protein VLB29_13225 [Nocardioidaceae bacterium]|nr:hypothetical protein [Nocardioidaceae bacterium]
MGVRRSSSAFQVPARPESRLIGRGRELEVLRQLLAEHRLVTVTGPGGVGKTSLALEAASALAADGADLVVCELAEVESSDAVRHAVAASLGVVLRPGESLAVSVPWADDGPNILCVLDNCEHVADAAAHVTEQLLRSGSRVRVLATSREPLRRADEHLVVLTPLPVSELFDEAAAESPAVVLFVERASRADPGFDLDDRTLPDVVRICQALDGLPLALEIAAARVRVLAVRDIADALSDRFALLRDRTRRIPERHRSLRAVFDWSWDLLAPHERDLFTALCVFPGGWDLQAATSVGQAVEVEAREVVDVLDGLVAKSLMTVTRSPRGTRYGMLETLRAYGLDRIRQAGVSHLARDRHADYFAGLARSLRDLLVRAWTVEASPLFEEFDNLRSALTWTLAEDAGPDRSFDLLAPLWYAALQIHAGELAELTGKALEKWPDPTHPRWSEVAGTAATAHATLEDYDQARILGGAAAGAASSSQVGRAFGYCALADVADRADDDPLAALEHLERADDMAAAAAFEPLRCDLMNRRAQLFAQAGRLDEAIATAEQARQTARKQGNAFELAWSQHLIGLLLVRDEPEAAREWLTRALEESRALLYPYGTSSSLRGLAMVSVTQGELESAAELFGEALDGFGRAGHPGERWNTVAALLSLLVAAGRRESAAALLVGLDGTGAVVSRIHTPLLQDVRNQLADEVGVPRIVARGRAMSPEQLLELARDELRLLRRVSGRVGVPEQRPGEERGEPSSGSDPTASMEREGRLWRATYDGRSVHLPDLRGVRDLAVLLEHPDREVAALDLATPPGEREAGTRRSGAGLGAPGDLGEQIDARARAEYAERIRELQAELDDADSSGDDDRGARAQEELDFLTHELTAAYGIHGPRRAGDPAEKARSAVTARIRAAIARIREVHPALGRHLEASVRTGRFCSYRPERPMTWVVTR